MSRKGSTESSQVRQHVNEKETVVRLVASNRVKSEVKFLKLAVGTKSVQLIQVWHIVVISLESC